MQKGKAICSRGRPFARRAMDGMGEGLADIAGLRGKLPRNFTDHAWQATRADGELFWVLKNGSPGTDMAPFIPLVLTEEEAWHVLLYVRSFGNAKIE